MKNPVLLIVTSLLLGAFPLMLTARRIHVPAPKKGSTDSPAEVFYQNVERIDDDRLALYRSDSVIFSKYDKTVDSNVETFFVTNRSRRTLSGMKLELKYMTEDGSELHRRVCDIPCNVPPGETRRVDIRSWDRQNTFCYIGSRMPRRRVAIPYKVTLTLRQLTFPTDKAPFSAPAD